MLKRHKCRAPERGPQPASTSNMPRRCRLIWADLEEVVIAREFPPGVGVFEVGVETHGRAAIGREFGDRRADAGAFILAERERLVVERAANVARLQSSLAERAGCEVGEVRRIAGAIPEIIFIPSPQLARQKAAL